MGGKEPTFSLHLLSRNGYCEGSFTESAPPNANAELQASLQSENKGLEDIATSMEFSPTKATVHKEKRRE